MSRPRGVPSYRHHKQSGQALVAHKEDVQLLKAMGMKIYRFSIAWPRVFPNGMGTPNPKGLGFLQQAGQ